MHVDRRILRRAREAHIDLALTVGLNVLSGVAVVFQAHYLSRAVGGVFINGLTRPDVRTFLLFFIALAGVRSLFAWAGEIFAQRVAGRVKTALRAALTRHLLTLGPGFARGERTGELTNTVVEGVEALDAYLAQYLPRLAMAAILPLVLVSFVLPVDTISGVILLVTAPLIPLFMSLVGGRAEEKARRQWLTLSRMSAQLLDALQGLTTLKLLGRSRDAERHVRETSEAFHHTTMGVLKVAFLSALALEMTATISTALVAVGVGLRLLYGRLGFQEALFVLILAPEFYRPLRSLGSAFHAGLPGAEAAKRIFSILATPAPTEAGSARPVPSGPATIELDEVCFSFGKGHPLVLDRVCLRIPAGKKVALVGPTGAGKSTLVHLLLRFADPDSGVIRVDGVPLSEIDRNVWRNHVAWVPQFPHLFHGTVAENIRLAWPEASLDEVKEAARHAYAHSFIEELPGGYDSPVGEGGVRLSGGQAQRIALARAFLKRASVLILDEPTSQLDPEHEAFVQDAIHHLMMHRTVVLIAHRLSNVFDADQIVLLSAGKVVEEGSHASLMNRGRFYPRLVEAYHGGTS